MPPLKRTISTTTQLHATEILTSTFPLSPLWSLSTPLSLFLSLYHLPFLRLCPFSSHSTLSPLTLSLSLLPSPCLPFLHPLPYLCSLPSPCPCLLSPHPDPCASPLSPHPVPFSPLPAPLPSLLSPLTLVPLPSPLTLPPVPSPPFSPGTPNPHTQCDREQGRSQGRGGARWESGGRQGELRHGG